MDPQLFITIAAVITAIAAIGKALHWIYQVARKLEVLDDIAHEFKPNSGQSLRDSIDRIENNLENAIDRLTRLEDDHT